LEAPIAAILLYAFWVWRSEEMGMWGFFFPGTYPVVIALGGLGAWLIGRECVLVRRWHRWRRAAVVFSILGLAVPIAARMVESAWARYLSADDAGFAFRLPGIQVVVTDSVSGQRQKGLTFSRVLTYSDGRPMVMLHHTDGDTPPYLLFGALAAGALALRSRRTALI
jgi:MYXO-CTERM domain-containing protein